MRIHPKNNGKMLKQNVQGVTTLPLAVECWNTKQSNDNRNVKQSVFIVYLTDPIFRPMGSAEGSEIVAAAFGMMKCAVAYACIPNVLGYLFTAASAQTHGRSVSRYETCGFQRYLNSCFIAGRTNTASALTYSKPLTLCDHDTIYLVIEWEYDAQAGVVTYIEVYLAGEAVIANDRKFYDFEGIESKEGSKRRVYHFPIGTTTGGFPNKSYATMNEPDSCLIDPHPMRYPGASIDTAIRISARDKKLEDEIKLIVEQTNPTMAKVPPQSATPFTGVIVPPPPTLLHPAPSA